MACLSSSVVSSLDPSSEPRPARATHLGPDAARLAVVVGVHGGQGLLGLLASLGRVGDEVALVQDVRDGPVGHLDGPLRVLHEDPLDLGPLLLVAGATLLGEWLHLPFHAPAPRPELPLGLLLGARLPGGALVLRAELLPRPLPLLLPPLSASFSAARGSK